MKTADFNFYLKELLEKRPDFSVTSELPKPQLAGADSPHLHSGWEIVVLEDAVKFNPMFVTHEKNYHVVFSIEFDLLNIICHTPQRGGFRRWRIPPELSGVHLAPELCTLLMRMLPEKQVTRELFYSAVASLSHVLCQLDAADWGQDSDHTVAFLTGYLNSHYYQPDLSLDSLSDMFGISPQYLNRIMRAAGYPPVHTLLVNIRLEKALELLKSGRYSIGETARLTGWRSPLYFSSRFKLKYGVPPGSCMADSSQNDL